MRWFYVPNEGVEGDQIGPRRAFEKLLAEGAISHYDVYSYLVRGRELGNHEAALRDFLDRANSFKPDVIFVQHMNDSYPLSRDFLRELKRIPSQPKLVLHEGDAYGHFIKPLDRTLRAVIAEADMSFLVGLGSLAELAIKAGGRNIRYAPHSYDGMRFGTPWTPSRVRRFDAVMIANLPCIKRIPWLYMPGGRSRKLTARAMHKALGDRFALFGRGQGWKGEPYCRGPLPFDEQGATIRDAWMSVNWHQFDEIAMYSSDRLPIGLASGIPHITNRQPSYRFVFDNIPGLFVVETPREAADVALYMMSLTADRRIELGIEAARYAAEHLCADRVYADIVAVVREQLFAHQSLAE
ncbi:glycosyltransferase family protein [Thauera sinica]|uniref:Spore protein YkvP/CgeB glycosyl transferase-like domain-containing protein n=1 Tax=Thauera sinica TaxID=2665146 RepID=A0ABW1AN15_9RHOO|nr:hypothetical protein [Thauera sp. K11]